MLGKDEVLSQNFTRSPYTQLEFDEEFKNSDSNRFTVCSFLKFSGKKIYSTYCNHNILHENNSNNEQQLASLSRQSEENIEIQHNEKKHINTCNKIGFFINYVFPFINVLRNYEFKNWFPSDIICGFTVGVMQIPQGMAYAMLATVPTIYGLYTSLFAPIFYFFLGTSRNLSLGTIAILSLLVGNCLDRKIGPLSESNSTTTEDRVLLATSLSMATGITQSIVGVLRLGCITRYLSDPMISGFTVGSAVHVVVSQLKTALGIKVVRRTGLFNIPLQIYDICATLPSTNLVTLGFSLVTIAVLCIFKLWINPPIMKKFKIPIPIELFVVILGAITSWQLDLGSKYGLAEVGPVPVGIPLPKAPDLSITFDVISDFLIIALIGFSINYSLASVYSEEDGDKIDSNRELIAYGVTNILGSFFNTFPSAASLSRTSLQVSMNGKTLIVGLISSLVVLMVVLFAGPLFKTVPNCCLSSIILVALRSIFLKVRIIPKLWKHSIWDLLTWIITFAATVFLDVIFGLVVGIAFSVLAVVLRTQAPKMHKLGQIKSSEVFKPVSIYHGCREYNKIRIVRYEGSLYYASVDHFYSSLITAVEFDVKAFNVQRKKYENALYKLRLKINEFLPNSIIMSDDHDQLESFKLKKTSDIQSYFLNDNSANFDPNEACVQTNTEIETKQLKKPYFEICCSCTKYQTEDELINEMNRLETKLSNFLNSKKIKCIILDCSSWNFIDIVGLDKLISTINELNEADISVYLAEVSDGVQSTLKNHPIMNSLESPVMFISVYDALAYALQSSSNEDT